MTRGVVDGAWRRKLEALAFGEGELGVIDADFSDETFRELWH